jgi:hypothetical protein
MYLKLFGLFIVFLVVAGFLYHLSGNKAEALSWTISYSPDGLTSLASDGEFVYLTRNAVEYRIDVPNVISFEWMDNSSALMNRSAGNILIINALTHQVFLMGQDDGYCDPCNIGGGGTDVFYPTNTPVTPTIVPTKG